MSGSFITSLWRTAPRRACPTASIAPALPFCTGWEACLGIDIRLAVAIGDLISVSVSVNVRVRVNIRVPVSPDFHAFQPVSDVPVITGTHGQVFVVEAVPVVRAVDAVARITRLGEPPLASDDGCGQDERSDLDTGKDHDELLASACSVRPSLVKTTDPGDHARLVW